MALGIAGWALLGVADVEDPFADLEATRSSVATGLTVRPASGVSLVWRKELYGLLATGHEPDEQGDRTLSRLSAGFEAQARLSSPTRTFVTLNYQGRLVYRHHPRDVRADPMGMEADLWDYETHNAYADLLNLLGAPGRLNLRVGHFYQPFGLNQQTDTHGTLLQLSNEQLLGSERDWQAVLFGDLSRHLDYAVGWLAGAGHDWDFGGQSGLAVARLALSSDWLFRHGLEGGVSGATGERYAVHPTPTVDPHDAGDHAAMGHPTPMTDDTIERLWRVGADLRKRFNTSFGALSLTGEAACGEDDSDAILSGLAQGDWLHPRRRWGMALQYADWRRRAEGTAPELADTRLSAVLTHYLRNDIANASLHWIALGIEETLRRPDGTPDTHLLLQYYRYW